MTAVLCVLTKLIALIGNAIWSLVLAFVGVLFALWYENIGRPNLMMSVSPTRTNIKSGDLGTRFLSLKVQNLPRRAPLVRRQTATATHGTIAFLDTTRREVAGPLHVRWDGKAECIKYLGVRDRVVPVFDPSLVRQGRYIDIPPDEAATLAVAFRIDGDIDAYGWSNESYAHPNWRNPEFTLPAGEYIARITIASGDSVSVQDFSFSNQSEDAGGFEFEVNRADRAG